MFCFFLVKPGLRRNKNVVVDVACVHKGIVREHHKDIEIDKRIQAKQTWLCVAITYFHFSSQKFLKPSVPLFGPLHHSVQTNIRRKLEKSKRAVEGNRRWGVGGSPAWCDLSSAGILAQQPASERMDEIPPGLHRHRSGHGIQTRPSPLTLRISLHPKKSVYFQTYCSYYRTKQGKQDPWTKQSIASGQICPEEPTEAELQRIPPLLFFLCRHYFLYWVVSLHHILHYTMYMIPIKAQLIPTLVFFSKTLTLPFSTSRIRFPPKWMYLKDLRRYSFLGQTTSQPWSLFSCMRTKTD